MDYNGFVAHKLEEKIIQLVREMFVKVALICPGLQIIRCMRISGSVSVMECPPLTLTELTVTLNLR